MYLGNGSTASATNVVFVGQATTSGSAVTATVMYNYNGRCHYQTSSNLPAGSTATAVPCYFGHNVGLTSKLTAVNVISELNYTVGQVAEIDQASSNVAIFDGVSMKMLTVAGGVQTKNYSTGVVTAMTVANWRWIADVWRAW
jgi:ABC-type transport system involved in cytochrome c biogenesis ATPase subunit